MSQNCRPRLGEPESGIVDLYRMLRHPPTPRHAPVASALAHARRVAVSCIVCNSFPDTTLIDKKILTAFDFYINVNWYSVGSSLYCSADLVAVMTSVGNALANGIWEANYKGRTKPTPSSNRYEHHLTSQKEARTLAPFLLHILHCLLCLYCYIRHCPRQFVAL